MEKLKIYISIPITGKDYKKQREHADDIARSLSRQGWDVVNPFNIYAGKNATYEDHIAFDLRALMDCDAIVMCKGWEHSFGCTLEYSYAQLCKRYQRKDFKLFLEQELN